MFHFWKSLKGILDTFQHIPSLEIVKGSFGLVKVYVPDLEHTQQHEINEILFYCVHNTPVHGEEIVMPDFPCLTERQYMRLPDRLKVNFNERIFDVKLKELSQ